MNELFRSIALLERPVDELDVTGMTLLGHFFPTGEVDLWPRQAWMIASLEKADAGSPLLPLEEAED